MDARAGHPAPYEGAKNIRYRPNTQELLAPGNSTATYLLRDQTENDETRLGLRDHLAWGDRRFFGYVGCFRESPPGNTSTTYCAPIVRRIAIVTGYNFDPQWRWAKVDAFPPNPSWPGPMRGSWVTS